MYTKESMKLCTIIVPCYNEQETIPIFYQEITTVFKELEKELEFELFFY